MWVGVLARYSEKVNGLREKRVVSFPSQKSAFSWFEKNGKKHPISIYFDGAQNLDCFFPFFYFESEKWKNEMKKIRDFID